MDKYDYNLDTGRKIGELHHCYRQAAEDLLEPIISQLEAHNKIELFQLVKIDLGGRLIPVMYLYRHSLELQLKHAIALLHQLDGNKPKRNTEHRVSNLWNTLKKAIPNHFSEELSQSLLNPLTNCIDAMTILIEGIDTIDPNSFTFRYDDSRDQKPELNVKWVKESFESCANSLEQIISGLIAFIDYKYDGKA